MRSSEFVQAYPLDIAPEVIHAGAHSELIPDAQNWSYKFGRMLHSHLAGTQRDVFKHTNEMDAYREWTYGFNDLEWGLLGQPDGRGLRALNEVNFHLLNKSMHGAWRAVQEGSWSSEGTRLHSLQASERALAIDGFAHYAARQQLVDKKGAHSLVGTPNMLHNTFTGMIQEVDAALVLSGVARKHPGMTVVPAPLNFERTKKRTNVDFVVVDTIERRAVGVQVKTNVQKSDVEIADQRRVMFIDGTVDFNNVKAMRTQRNSSTERAVPWAGLIAAKLVDGMKPDIGRRSRYGTRLSQSLKDLAHEMVGSMKVDYRETVTKIEERILAKL